MNRGIASFLVLCMAACSFLSANNLQITQTKIAGPDLLEFDMSWENSWRFDSQTSPFNHDAVWVFVKIRQQNGSWNHLDLSPVPGDYQVSLSSLEVVPVSDQKGVYVRPSQPGSGNTGIATVRLKLAQALNNGNYDIRVYGIEMVYIPEGSFFLGDSLANNTFRIGANPAPFQVNAQQVIQTGTSGGQLFNGGTYPPEANIPASWPNGFEAFYCMKYELSQEQYADFLNTLTYDQQEARTVRPPSSPVGTYPMAMSQGSHFRNGIAIRTSGQAFSLPAIYGCDMNGNSLFFEMEDARSRACNFLSFADLMAYFDWSGLRPMTEMEFEKVCRGNTSPSPLEFAWGTDLVEDANTVQMDGTETETVSEKGNEQTGVASHGYFGPQGPLRCGFNGHATSDRLETGASFYGAFEMSGNLWEQCISVSLDGLTFDGEHGDGELDTQGDANVSGWSVDGSGYRGGGWNSGILAQFRDLAVSDRFYAGLVADQRRNTSGGRGVRSE